MTENFLHCFGLATLNSKFILVPPAVHPALLSAYLISVFRDFDRHLVSVDNYCFGSEAVADHALSNFALNYSLHFVE